MLLAGHHFVLWTHYSNHPMRFMTLSCVAALLIKICLAVALHANLQRQSFCLRFKGIFFFQTRLVIRTTKVSFDPEHIALDVKGTCIMIVKENIMCLD